MSTAAVTAAVLERAGTSGRKKAKENQALKIREALEGQILFAGCGLCGESREGNAWEVIAWQIAHRRDVHGLEKTDVQAKARAMKRAAEPKRSPEEVRRLKAEGGRRGAAARAAKTAARAAEAAEARARAKAFIRDYIREHQPVTGRNTIIEAAVAAGVRRTYAFNALKVMRIEGQVEFTQGYRGVTTWRPADDA